MMLLGRIFREGGGWSAHCDIVGVYTQGPTRKVAEANLAEAIEMLVERDGFEVTVTKIGSTDTGDHTVFVDATEPALLAVEVLKHQRERSKLTLAEVANKLGAASVNSYAAYEQGKREPSLSKFRELLAVVAPDMVLTVGPRTSSESRKRRT